MKNHPHKKNFAPTQKELCDYFQYKEDGSLVKKCNCKWRPVGSVRPDGYKTVTVMGKPFKAHRLIYAMHFGDIAEGMEIDHINGDRSDNRIENLRLVDRKANMKNNTIVQKVHSGWKCSVRCSGVVYELGIFHSPKEAKQAAEIFRQADEYKELLL
jgi:hypothetical protein